MTRSVKSAWIATLIALLTGLSNPEPVSAQADEGEASIAASETKSPWEFVVTPYLFALSLDGDTTLGNNTSDIDVGFDDILKNLNFAAMIEGEARYKRVGGFVNFLFGDIGGGDTIRDAVKIDATVKLTWLSFGASYRLGPYALGASPANGGSGPTVTIDPYVGGRFTNLDVQLDFKDINTVSGSRSWVDPIIGIRTIWDITERWNVIVLGDIGGFGVASDFTWQATGVVGYRFGLFGDRDANVVAGYRALYQDFKDGSGADRFEWDVTAHGPVIGLAVHF